MIPYVFAGPEVNLPSPVNIRYTDGEFTVDELAYMHITYGDNMQTVEESFKPLVNVSAVAGGGMVFQIPTSGSNLLLKVDAALNIGLLNQTRISDVRIYGNSLELCVSLLFPIKKRLFDGCHFLEDRR